MPPKTARAKLAAVAERIAGLTTEEQKVKRWKLLQGIWRAKRPT
jgi:hypothetical protein